MSSVVNLDTAFREIVKSYPNRIALSYPESGERISYAELEHQVDSIASALLERGLQQGQVTAIFHDKSRLAFASMLACLRLGIVYTVLDPDSPWDRLHKILKTCRPDIIVCSFQQLPHESSLTDSGFTSILNLNVLLENSGNNKPATGHHITGGSAAYIMFTSGSTGIPKGAVMSHANLLWFISWARERFAVTQNDVMTNVNPMFFDNSVFDFYVSIFSGATLVPFVYEQVRDTRQLVRLLNACNCTIWFSVPSLLVYLLTTRALSSIDLGSIRKIIFGGEGFPKSKLRMLYEMFGSRADLENVYGPTECTCICSAYTINEHDFEDMHSLAPLGEIAKNFSYEVLPQVETQPDFGELCLLGPQVGLGYYNDPERTAKSFIQNPKHARHIEIGYLTGDLVFRDSSGLLHFRGRRDYQIKHLGYRIELEEIESAFNTIGEVKECGVIYQMLHDGIGCIVAYVAMGEVLELAEIRSRIATIVPSYMVPRTIVILNELPKNANGKIDRRALKDLAQEALAEDRAA